MAKISPNAPCPCGRSAKYKKCCGLWHGGRPAPTPEALMRSRYSAYALGLVDYVMATTHPDGPHHGRYGQRDEIEQFCRTTSFDGLEVLESSTDGDDGMVAFRATLSQAGRDASFGERSRFHRLDGRWLYHSGDRIQ